ncbi:MAG: hypothetical protein RIQ33_2031 [Bacteroidota bacterium]
MKKQALIILFILISIKVSATHWYVNINASGANNGTSWADAFTDLQLGLGATVGGDSVWVAQGVYKPTTTNTRTIPFVLPSSCKVFGGFNGTETLLSQRNFISNITILSGNIGNTALTSDNSYTVVSASNVSSSTLLDGFKIIAGHNTVGSFQGPGFNNKNGSPTVANCIFQDNYTAYYGGALCSTGSGSITIKGCTFLFNNALSNGGAIYVDANATISDCIIKENLASLAAGGIYLDGGNVNIDRCIITKNEATASHSGAIGVNDAAIMNLTNSLIVGNYSDWAAAMYIVSFNNFNTYNIVNCTFANNKSNLGLGNNDYPLALTDKTNMYNCILSENTGSFNNQTYKYTNEKFEYNLINGGVFGGTISGTNMYANPKFINPALTISAPFDATLYDYHLNSLSKGIDAGKNSYISPIYNYDLDSLSRTFGNKVDMGAYEKNYCLLSQTFTTSTGSDSICWGKLLTVNATQGKYFSWNNGDTTATVLLNAGKYFLTAVDSLGCISKDSFTVKNYKIPVSISALGPTSFCTGKNVTLNTIPSFSNYAWSAGGSASSIVVSTSGTITVTVTDANGCKGTASQVVTVTPIPVTINASGPTNFCAGGNVTLSTSQVFSNYNWSNSNTSSSIQVNSSGTYSVTVADGNGCSGTASQIVNVYNLPSPTIIQNGIDLTTSQSFASYQWYLNGAIINNANNAIYTPTHDGSYTVEVTNANNCKATSIAFNVIGLGIENALGSNFIDVFPNPTSQQIFIKGGDFIRYEIQNLLGEKIYSNTLQQSSIDISNLQNGCYFLFLYDVKNNLSIKQFVKK